ncbi:hypothetical protein PHJA_001144800 [Phtheirospermum japonicum]|uniref:Uncharacterized protein n=1 Tax=Phtheirospermum japonicum TaxID=374723 RepID=A0A830BR53_9LAMI|nr:hypothetical protein PHJA_001144800 [Phtheirospermum japonicum]
MSLPNLGYPFTPYRIDAAVCSTGTDESDLALVTLGQRLKKELAQWDIPQYINVKIKERKSRADVPEKHEQKPKPPSPSDCISRDTTPATQPQQLHLPSPTTISKPPPASSSVNLKDLQATANFISIRHHRLQPQSPNHTNLHLNQASRSPSSSVVSLRRRLQPLVVAFNYQKKIEDDMGAVIIHDSSDEEGGSNIDNESINNILLNDEGDTTNLNDSLIGVKRKNFEDIYQLYCEHARQELSDPAHPV